MLRGAGSMAEKRRTLRARRSKGSSLMQKGGLKVAERRCPHNLFMPVLCQDSIAMYYKEMALSDEESRGSIFPISGVGGVFYRVIEGLFSQSSNGSFAQFVCVRLNVLVFSASGMRVDGERVNVYGGVRDGAARSLVENLWC